MLDIYEFFSDQECEEWLKTLPDYQEKSIRELLKKHNEMEVAEIWLESTVTINSPFSTSKPHSEKKYLDIVKKEVHKLLCGGSEYEKERNELATYLSSGNNKTYVISSLSAYIGSNIGLSSTFIAPVIVMIIITISKVALNSWCELNDVN